MLVATLRTRIIEKNSLPFIPAEGGVFEQEIRAKKEQLTQARDPRGYVTQLVGTYLAAAVRDTNVPQDYWLCEFSPFIQKELNFPPVIKFDGR